MGMKPQITWAFLNLESNFDVDLREQVGRVRPTGCWVWLLAHLEDRSWPTRGIWNKVRTEGGNKGVRDSRSRKR